MEDINKPSNIQKIIVLFTVLHIVAEQPIEITKKATSMLILVITMVTRNEFLMLFLMLLRDNIFFYILTITKLFASLSFIAKQYKMQKMLIKSVKIQVPKMGVWKTNIGNFKSLKVICTSNYT